MSSTTEFIKNIKSPYETDRPAMCYPGTCLLNDTGEIAKIVIPKNLNMIGSPTLGITSDMKTLPPSEGGFEIPHQLERDYIQWIGKYFCKKTDPKKILDIIDGYFCGGGTEGNIEGLWIGREYLRHLYKGEIAVILTQLTHYSIPKGLFILDINKNIQYVELNKNLEMDEKNFYNTVKTTFTEKKIKNFIVVGTVGTTLCGSVDPISEIDKYISILKKELGVNIYFHVDASFGGYTLPFITDKHLIGFENENLMSIVVDGHKMGNLPYSAGIFLCRKNLQQFVKIDVPYVGSHMDVTVSGSRSFLSIAYGWHYINKYGDKWHTDFVNQCIMYRNKLVARLEKIKGVTILPYSPYVNLLPISIDEKYGNSMPKDYQMRGDIVKLGGKTFNVYKLCILPHTFKSIDSDDFATDLEKVLA